MITAITCTGSRPEAFKLCVSHMVKQSYKEAIQWIIINDDLNSAAMKPLLKGLPKNITPELYQGPEVWKPGVKTLDGNLLQALPNVVGDKVLFFEDDDYYASNFIEMMDRYLNFADIVGEVNASYYNVKLPGWRRMQNYNQASLCQTGIKANLLPLLTAAIGMDGNIDGNLWEIAHKQATPCILFSDMNLCVGIKGLPGREGLGIGHKFEGYIADPYLVILKRWLGDDAAQYLPYTKGLTHAVKQEGKQNPKANAKNVQSKKSAASLLSNGKREKDNRSREVKEFVPSQKA